MGRAAVILCLLVWTAGTAAAEPWHRGKYGKNRIVHLSATAAGGILYPATDWLEARWAPTSCSWCTPTSIDRRVRGLRWADTDTPGMASNITAYGLTPVMSIGLVLIATPSTWADRIDNVVPIVEAMVVTEWLTRGIKLTVARQRPYAHFGTVTTPNEEDNLSFPSGHTSRAFSLATAAGVIAHVRGYAVEPYVWAVGMTLAATSGYLRIAADKHYATDVLAGATLGVAAGLTVPWLMRRDVEVVPARGGIALAGSW